MHGLSPQVQSLIARGVSMPEPQSVYVDTGVTPDRIAPGVVLHPGCRLRGATTSIGPGCVLGEEAPVTIEDCQLGARVALRGGYFSGAVLRDDAAFGSAAHVRPGTLLEEQATCGHAVGLKQTILMPFVTTGSLVNFCDCLMAGGTGRRNHSEVGSSYVHFNFTPHQDKATASLFGDVPRGVMLDQPPIFLGGQGGAVGPCRVEFGVVVAAGTVLRRDVFGGGVLCFGPPAPDPAERPHETGAYNDIRRVVANGFAYIGNLWALQAWHRGVRARFLGGTPFDAACHAGALEQISTMIAERVKRLRELAGNMPRSLALARRRHGANLPERPYAAQRIFSAKWPALEAQLVSEPAEERARDAFFAALDGLPRGTAYLDAIRGLDPAARQRGTAWLQAVVDSVTALWTAEADGGTGG